MAINTKLENLLASFSKEFWFAPSDVFLRATEAYIWSKQKIKSPVLDIGCGDGRISKLLFQGRKKIDVGLDVDSQEVKNARKTRLYKKVVLANASKLPFKDKNFNFQFHSLKRDALCGFRLLFII